MEIIVTAHNNTFDFKDIELKEGKKYRVIIKEVVEEEIAPEVLALVGIIKNEKVYDLKEYLSENKRLDYESIRWYQCIFKLSLDIKDEVLEG